MWSRMTFFARYPTFATAASRRIVLKDNMTRPGARLRLGVTDPTPLTVPR